MLRESLMPTVCNRLATFIKRFEILSNDIPTIWRCLLVRRVYHRLRLRFFTFSFDIYPTYKQKVIQENAVSIRISRKINQLTY